MATLFTITGMHCVSCKSLIEEVCREVPGVASCTVNPETNTGVVTHDESFQASTLRQEIEALGSYRVTMV